MNYKLIGDSCSDLDQRQLKSKHYLTVPLVLQIGSYHISDDKNFDRKDFIKRMRESKVGAKTACPSPEAFRKAYEDADADCIFVVTLSEHLSGTYQSAVLAKHMYEEEENADKKVFVLSSHSASAGQYRILLELERLCELDIAYEEICERITKFRDNMKTYFVLESLETLRKNGRLSGLSAFFATTLNIKPVMGAVDGKIIKLDQARGINKALTRMVDIALRESGEDSKEKIVAIAECNNPERGEFVAKMFKDSNKFKDVLLTQTAGVATVYAGDGGIVVSIG